MAAFSRRDLHAIYSVLLLAVVVLSWSYVIYASRIAAYWLLEEKAAVLQKH
ncbi:uncharacterized protein ACO6RY_03028 [Pungitius sinensis]